MGIYDLMQGIQQQGEEGRKRGLQALVGKAYAAPQDQRQQILATVAQRGEPGMALEADKAFGAQEDNVHLQMAKRAREVVALYKANPAMAQQIYQNGLIPIAQRAGIQNAPMQLDDSLIPGLEKLASAVDTSKSADLQEFDAMTAGMTPDDVARARRINLGLDPRAVTGAMRFDTFSGADGRPRPQRNNPTTGQVEIFYDEMGQWVPLGGGAGGAPAPQAAPTKVDMEGDIQLANDLIAAGIPGDRVDAFLASRGQRAETAQGAAPIGGSGLGVGRRPEDEAAAKTGAETAAKLQYLPAELGLRTDAAVRQAEEIARNNAQVTQDSSTAKLAMQRATTLQMYETAMKGLREGLAGTETGPIAGRIPAFTSSQQIAEGAVAAMAPILKQLFRASGEGTFTDRDQALLLEMVPKRTDTPEARAAKMQNIDAIVRAKLGAQPTQVPRTPAPQSGGASDPLGIL